MKVLVCQRGARHRYAIPRLLEEAGMLAALYTDSSAYSVLGRIAAGIGGLGIQPSGLQALAARIPKGIPKAKIYSSDREIGCLLSDESPWSLGRVYKRWGLKGASVVYSMYGENPDFLEWAKGQGAKILIDVFVHPKTNRIVAEEESRVHGHELVGWSKDEDEHSRRVFEVADLLLCPSGWVASGVREFAPDQSHKIRILPYGSSISIAESPNTPDAGRILFAGREPLRKGLHYLADAAHRVRQTGMHIDVRAAGIDRASVEWMKQGDEIHMLGTLPMDQMHAEYDKADMVVFPSLSEGQAGVLLEAMACGCPVIATRESGVDFEPGCGITVPVQNAEELAGAIMSVVGNREERDQLARGALRQAAGFSMDEWKRRLVLAVEEVSET